MTHHPNQAMTDAIAEAMSVTIPTAMCPDCRMDYHTEDLDHMTGRCADCQTTSDATTAMDAYRRAEDAHRRNPCDGTYRRMERLWHTAGAN